MTFYIFTIALDRINTKYYSVNVPLRTNFIWRPTFKWMWGEQLVSVAESTPSYFDKKLWTRFAIIGQKFVAKQTVLLKTIWMYVNMPVAICKSSLSRYKQELSSSS